MNTKKDDKELLDDILNLYEDLKEKRSKREAEWKDVCLYLGSKILDWREGKSDVKRPVRHTGRPTEYLDKLSSGLMGYTISPNITWLKLSLTDDSLLDYDGVKKWIEDCEKQLYAEFNRNNLYLEAGTFIKNAAMFGHGVMLIDEKEENRTRFLTMSEPEIYLSTNEYNDVDTVFRSFKMSVKNMASRFGEENLPEALKEKLKDVKGKQSEVNIINAVFARDDADNEKMGSKNMPYASFYIDLDNKKILEESGYYELPYATFIWEKISGQAYGDSPSLKSIPDMRLLNKIEESSLKLAQLAAQPPMNVPESMRGHESVVPAGYNYYAKPNEIMTPISIGANYPVTIDTKKDIESRIKDKFHVDFLIMLQAQTAQKTATEVIELQGEKAAVLSSLIINQNKALAEIVKRTFNIMMRQDRLPKPPATLNGSGASLNIDFVGPLAQAQKKYHQIGGVQASMALAQPIIQMNPNSLDYINTDKLLKEVLVSNGFPQKAIREEKEVMEIRQQQMQAQQAMMQQQQQQGLLNNFDKLNKPIEEGSPISELSKQMQGGIESEQRV